MVIELHHKLMRYLTGFSHLDINDNVDVYTSLHFKENIVNKWISNSSTWTWSKHHTYVCFVHIKSNQF